MHTHSQRATNRSKAARLRLGRRNCAGRPTPLPNVHGKGRAPLLRASLFTVLLERKRATKAVTAPTNIEMMKTSLDTVDANAFATRMAPKRIAMLNPAIVILLKSDARWSPPIARLCN
jgi:hypothetical protein